MAFGTACATVTEPMEIEVQSLTFFRGTAGAYEYVIWERDVETTKHEARGMSLFYANAKVQTQKLNSPKSTYIGGGGWNVSWVVTEVTAWEEQ